MSPTVDTITSPSTESDLCGNMGTHTGNVTDNKPVTPQDMLNQKSEQWKVPTTSEDFARKLDEADPLRSFRNEFHFPKMSRLPLVDQSLVDPNAECVYLCGHSLGLEPKRLRKFIDIWLQDWADLGVFGHLNGSNPFALCDYPCIPTLQKLLGARDKEVAVMNQLTTNIHFLMISFYRPTKERFKILYEERAFPSDEYAFRSQIQFHGFNVDDAVVLAKPRTNETCIRTEDILELLKNEGHSIALVILSGVQFYTGQLFDIKTITQAAQQYGCVVGWDLAHALGNVPLQLHDWNVDFGAFCSYKYLNSGAGCVGGIFVHSKHFDKDYPRFDGWWGNKDRTRFEMRQEIDRGVGADGYRQSNPSIHQCASLAASLELFEEAGIEPLRKKSKLLTQYLQNLIEVEINQSSRAFNVNILTPQDPDQRGAQLSLRIIGISAKKLYDELEKLGICLDVRGDVIRVSPVPLYNSFHDVYRFVSLLKEIKS